MGNASDNKNQRRSLDDEAPVTRMVDSVLHGRKLRPEEAGTRSSGFARNGRAWTIYWMPQPARENRSANCCSRLAG